MVEATMVLPIIILTVLSLIMLMIYWFSCIREQAELHSMLISESETAESVFEIKKKSTETSSDMGGVVSMIMSRELEERIYAVDESDMIRIGGLFYEKEQ